MKDIDVNAAMNKINEILDTLEQVENGLIEMFGIEVISAAKALNDINEMRNRMKQMRGEVIEFIV